IGMVLAGGCASGSLYKIGEGNGTSILAIIGISFGQAIFVDLDGIFNKLVPQSWIDSALSKKWIPSGKITSWFDYFVAGNVFNKKMLTIAKTKFISSLFSNDVRYFVGDAFINTILPSVILLALIYYFYPRKTFIRRRRGERGSTGIGDEIAGIWNMITSSKRTSTMGILIGITAGLHILAMRGMQLKYGVNNFGQLLSSMGYTKDVSAIGKVFDPGYWYITTQEAQFGAWILEKFGWNMRDNVFFGVMNGIPQLWRNPALWMSVGIVFGAMVMALLNNEFKFKLPKGELIVWGLGGGLLMGIGARVALGCNIGAFFIRVAGGDPGGWLFGIGMVVGAFVSVRFFNWWSERKMAKEMADFDIEF
ncbi:MAG: YeeE/YedE family protein, partial [Nitrospirae bacterium]|nr:YeeE/YedE family protein [Nitrospirota bacterium]